MLLWQVGHVRDTTSCCIAQSPGGRLEPRWLRNVQHTSALLCRELLPACCTKYCAENHSRIVVPRVTTGLVCQKLFPVCVPRIVPGATHGLMCRELCQELLMVCCAENCPWSYSWSVVPRATPELCRGEKQPIYSRRLASACFSRTQLPRCDRGANQSAQ